MSAAKTTLASVLPEFEAAGSARRHSLAALFSPKEASEPPPRTLAAAEEEGFEKGLAAARLEAEAALAEARADFESESAEARSRWLAEEAEPIVAGWSQALCELETRLADAAAHAIAPLVETAVARRAVQELQAAIGELLGSGEAKAIRVTGPQDLIDALRDRLADSAAAVVVHGRRPGRCRTRRRRHHHGDAAGGVAPACRRRARGERDCLSPRSTS